MAIPKEIFKEILYQALECEVGLAIETDDRRFLVRNLWNVRKELADPNLDKLIILQPANEGEVWVAHKDADE